MKKFLKSLPFLGSHSSGIGKLRWRYRCWKVDPTRRLRCILEGREGLFVVQIGSNDGLTGDPIHSLLRENPSWNALLVEPVPFLFERLRQNYSHNKNVRFENVAVTHAAGTTTFHYVDPAAKQRIPDLPEWYDQLGSFDRGHIVRQLGAAMEPYIVSDEIPTLPLAAVLERNQVSKIDVLHIDTEGFDWEILKQLDLGRFQPAAILFEHKHLAEGDKRAAVAFLKDSYRISDLDVSGDYLCERRSG
jgi:FkbM family methyltransferase